MRNMKRETIPASDAEVGMFIVGLDNGYIVDVEESSDLRGNYNQAFGAGLLLITFHDANGDENYLLLQPDHPLTVEYGAD